MTNYRRGNAYPQRKRVELNPNHRSDTAQEFYEELRSKIIGQERALKYIANSLQTFEANLTDPCKPISTMLFMGPTGVGKTRVVEVTAECLLGSQHSFTKVDCAEYQKSHEISKLIGSPPGYVGHTETKPVLCQTNLDRWQKPPERAINILLFDEVEKASHSLWNLLLGILDNGEARLNDNKAVDFTKTIIIMTSNLGSKEMAEAISARVGFAPAKGNLAQSNKDGLDKKIYDVAKLAASKLFPTEFVNRVDHTVVFHTLSQSQLRKILKIELNAVKDRILNFSTPTFSFECTTRAEEFLLREGTEIKFGARKLKRVINKRITVPLSGLAVSRQVSEGDMVYIDVHKDGNRLLYEKEHAAMLVENRLYATD